MPIQNYVVGFLFDPTLSRVVLIRKEKPAWQKGLLNGVGGKVELNESFEEAMAREFAEETGEWVSHWTKFTEVYIPNHNDPTYDKTDPTHNIILEMFYAVSSQLHRCRSITVEQLEIHNVEDVMNYTDMVPNLRWIIQMARSMHFGERAKYFEVYEQHD
jgi:8-oxo-dGTP diphosphatase